MDPSDITCKGCPELGGKADCDQCPDDADYFCLYHLKEIYNPANAGCSRRRQFPTGGWILRLNKYTPMATMGWHRVRPHFSPFENWGDPDRIDARLVFALFDIREHTGRKIIIHCGYEKRAKPSWHSSFRAVDFHIDGLHVCDQCLICSRYDVFNGLGVYPWWNNPGIHGDTRPDKMKNRPEARWISTGAGIYVPLTWKNFGRI